MNPPMQQLIPSWDLSHCVATTYGYRYLDKIILWPQHIITFPQVKGLVYPNMKIKSLITHPHAVPTP